MVNLFPVIVYEVVSCQTELVGRLTSHHWSACYYTARWRYHLTAPNSINYIVCWDVNGKIILLHIRANTLWLDTTVLSQQFDLTQILSSGW